LHNQDLGGNTQHQKKMAYTMDMHASMPGLVVRNTFLEFSGRDPYMDYEENRPGRTRAYSDISDNKLPWKVPLSTGTDAAHPGLFQITRKRFASEHEDFDGFDIPDLPSVLEENPATISQEAGSRVPPQFPGSLLGLRPDMANPWLFGSAGLSPTWSANLPPWNHMSMFPHTPPSLAAAAAALWKEQGARRNSASVKKDAAAEAARAKKKTPDAKKGQKEGISLPVGVQAKADKVPQPEPFGDPTTVMLRHIPNRYTSAQLVELLDAKGFKAKYDFVYLPIDFQNKVNLGYCFVNLLSHEWALRFKQEFEGFKEWLFDSVKASEVSWAHPHQGLTEHIERYRNSPVMHPSMPSEYKPLIFNNGVQIAFPPPTRTIKAPKVRTNRDRQGSKEV